ncbi:hypothetical protein B566_EDAN016807 [Ephemera danica]|nr:hypothetical protein B566_EDAN016807 [Ephemera danica]
MLLVIYSYLIVLLDLIGLHFQLIFSFIKAFLRVIRPTRFKSLREENIVITGAGHGIGRELALQLAELGARLALWDLDGARCEETAKDVRAKGGIAISYCCDISERSQVLDTATKVRKELGIVGMVINNAGVVIIHPLLDHGPQQIRKIFDVNVISHFWMLEAFLPDMIASNHGHIAAVCSMTGLMQALGEELKEDARKPNIHLTTIHPFIVNTGQVQRPRLRFPKLLGVQKPSHAAHMIIRAIRQNKQEASVPGWLLPLHDLARALPAETFGLLKNFVASGAEAHDPAWQGDAPHQAVMAILHGNCKSNNKLHSSSTQHQPNNGFGTTLKHRHVDLLGELGK